MTVTHRVSRLFLLFHIPHCTTIYKMALGYEWDCRIVHRQEFSEK